MPVSQLDPTAALIVIDLQKGLIGLPSVHPIKEIVGRVASLARAFRQLGQPVVLVNVTGAAPGRTDAGPLKLALPPDWTELLPELEQHPEDYRVTKQRWGAFEGTSLHERLQARGVTQVFITGVSTSAGVESTARSAHGLGYHVVLVIDAMTDLNSDAHDNSVKRIFPRLGQIDTTESVLKLLTQAH